MRVERIRTEADEQRKREREKIFVRREGFLYAFWAGESAGGEPTRPFLYITCLLAVFLAGLIQGRYSYHFLISVVGFGNRDQKITELPLLLAIRETLT